MNPFVHITNSAYTQSPGCSTVRTKYRPLSSPSQEPHAGNNRRGDGTLTLKAFCDADFGSEPEGNDQPMRSTTELLVYLQLKSPSTTVLVLVLEY